MIRDVTEARCGASCKARRFLTVRSAVVIISAALFASSACTGGAGGRNSSSADDRYNIDHLDVCRETDRKALGNLVSKTEEVEPFVHRGDGGIGIDTVRCVFTMRDADGREVILWAEVLAYKDPELNKEMFSGARYGDEYEGMQDFTVKGIGDIAYEKSVRRSSETSQVGRWSVDALGVLKGNIQIVVRLSIYGRHVPRSTVAPKVRAIAQGLLDTATTN